MPHKVIGEVTDDSSAIIVQSPEGTAKVVNRLDLLKFDVEHNSEQVKSVSREIESNKTSSSDSSKDELVTCTQVHTEVHDVDNSSRPRARMDDTLPDSETELRRSKRSTPTKHSNLHDLPRSAVRQEHIVLPEYFVINQKL